MNMFRYWGVWTGLIALAVVGAVSGAVFFNTKQTGTDASADDRTVAKAVVVPVEFVRPHKGIVRLSTQSGSIQAYEMVRLYAKVPGFMKKQNVDIGDRVKAGQVLAVLDVPELETQLSRGKAVLAQARSRVVQMKARVNSVTAEADAAKAAVTQAEATAKSSAAWVRFRQKQLTRMTELFALKSIDERLVDESKERFEASVETELSSKAAILTSKAHVVANAAKIESAQADVAFAEAEVDVSQAELEKYKVQLGFATITAPFDGVVTHRTSFPGDFVRSANEGGSHEPILTVQRTDLMRVIVYIPDRDVPFADPGDTVLVEIDALTGEKFPAKISRISKSEDAVTRLMRAEIDLPNPTGRICHGMYGKVSIVLDKQADQFSIPSSCLAGKSGDGLGEVYVIRDNRADLCKVRLGADNGLRVTVIGGLKAEDQVVFQPGSELSHGVMVAPTESKVGSEKGSSAH